MFNVRLATAADGQGVRRVHLDAFKTSQEADLVERLVRDGMDAVSMVAVDEGAVVGHVLLSRMQAEADGRRLIALGLAPLAVLPERQRQGIGAKLVEAALDEARSLDADIVFLLGEPEYYRRFGFRVETAEPFESSYAGPYFQAMVLSANVGIPTTGRADYAPAFAELE